MKKSQLFIVGFFILFGVLIFNDVLFASSSEMPYEAPILKIKNSLTGTVATSMGVIALVVSMLALVFGSELAGVIKGLVTVAFLVGLAVSANAVITKLTGASSGSLIVISANEQVLSDNFFATSQLLKDEHLKYE